MSILNKIGLGFMLALLVGLALETVMIHRLDQKYATEVANKKELTQKLKDATENLKEQHRLSDVTDKVILETAIKIDNNNDKGKAIREVVDNIAMKVANEKLTVSDADNAYVDSMWSAYCTGNEAASGCSARLANSKL